MTIPAHVGTPDPRTLTLLADLMEQQLGVSERAKQASTTLDRFCVEVEASQRHLDTLRANHDAIMAELLALGEEMSALLVEENQPTQFTGSIIIDNIIVEVEVQFRVVTRNGNHRPTIDAIAIKQGGERVDIVSQNSTSLVVYEDKELIMDTAINSLNGDTLEDTLRLVMTAVERWTLEHRHDNHFDLVIKLLIKCRVIVHPVEKEVNPVPVYQPQTRIEADGRISHWREGHERVSRYGVRHWVEGHWVSR